MLIFKRKYQVKMIGRVLQIGDYTSDDKGNAILVVGITSVSVEGEHMIIEGYGVLREY